MYSNGLLYLTSKLSLNIFYNNMNEVTLKHKNPYTAECEWKYIVIMRFEFNQTH